MSRKKIIVPLRPKTLRSIRAPGGHLDRDEHLPSLAVVLSAGENLAVVFLQEGDATVNLSPWAAVVNNKIGRRLWFGTTTGEKHGSGKK